METFYSRTFPPPSSTRLETKYRDIADGNSSTMVSPAPADARRLETKYRDIADGNKRCRAQRVANKLAVGNQVPRYSGWKPGKQGLSWRRHQVLETKYRDIADGNY